MVEYSSETIGYFSVINGVLEDPVFKTLNIDAVKKINHDKIPLDCKRQVPVAKNHDTVKHLLEFLQKNQLLPENTSKKEFSVLTRAASLLKLLLVDYKHEVPQLFEFSKLNANTTVIMDTPSGEDKNESDEENLTVLGEIVEKLLTLLPNGLAERNHGLYPLFVVVKHKYILSSGIVINLFVSKEVHSILPNAEAITPIDLRMNVFFGMANAMVIEKFMWKPTILSYLGGGLSQLMAVSFGDYQTNKITVLDDKTALCEARFLELFTDLLPHFLRELTRLKNDGRLERVPLSYSKQDIRLSIESDRWIKIFDAVSTHRIEETGVIDLEQVDHELVILGTCKIPINYPHHYYNADFVSLKNFCDGIYADFLHEPKCIKFYGTLDEFEQVQQQMPHDPLSKLVYINQEEQ